MIARMLLIALSTISIGALAVPPMNPPGLLPAAIARPLLEQDSGVAAARAGLEVALQEAGILDRSPYEWTARAAGQQRRLDTGPRYGEWHVGLERAIRLPGKAEADRELGTATVEESQARYGEALHEAARELMARWLDWLGAERAVELAASNLQSMQASFDAVDKRFRAGDASKLDLSIARAELAEQRRIGNDAGTQASVGWSHLSIRFPGIKRQTSAVPVPTAIGEDTAFWRDRILEESDELKVLQFRMRRAQAQAERARADKMPDPTLGIFTASEIGGREQYTGVTVSIPIPGGLRDARHARAVAAIEVSRREIEVRKRQLEANIASAIATARGTYNSLQIVREGAAAMQENAHLMQRAYALGEAELQALLQTRRQATAAANAALQAQVAALKVYYGLLVDAHLIWGLEHE